MEGGYPVVLARLLTLLAPTQLNPIDLGRLPLAHAERLGGRSVLVVFDSDIVAPCAEGCTVTSPDADDVERTVFFRGKADIRQGQTMRVEGLLRVIRPWSTGRCS